MKKIIGVDFDGVMRKTPKDWDKILNKLPQSLCGLINFLLGKPNKPLLKILQELKDHKIIVITSRPKIFEKQIRNFLAKYLKLSCVEIICTGPFRWKSKKINLLKKRSIPFFVDDHNEFRFSLKSFSIFAFSPEQFYNLYNLLSSMVS